jgi:hypothetical protein
VCQHVHQGVQQLRLTDRLEQACAEERLSVAGLAPACGAEQHQWQRAMACANAPCQLDSVHLRHVHVEDRKIELLASFEPLQRF